MNNINLLKYEIKRTIISKKYLYMILILMAFTYDSLTRLVIGGYYGTAPFSEWTYTFFVQLTSPLVMSIMIFMMTNIFNEKELRARKILFSAPIPQSKYYMLKIVGLVVTFILTVLVPIIMSFIYYKILFDFSQFINFGKYIIWFLIPTFIFLLGVGMVLGKTSSKLLYGLIPIAFLLGSINTRSILPLWLDIFGQHFFEMSTFAELFGRTSQTISFNLSSDFIYSRLVFIFLGIILLMYTCFKREKE
ncbi:hypothetical protein RBU61_11485 [Tissierella sp. MB52-C2]|uniref:hypothetical protein n=1 Tax=Tissierella sp. MB52-C2 TaxID=3070999 RepID=UPI00280B4594|nr:hypothetical protein [Tissierella sp. MB52-C2]WMM23575.1 hypothetical protein RBU61_11485 [Tissierella sp. MB52-C2]